MPITTKKIRDTRYIYFVYHDDAEGKQKHVCCGAESNPKARRKAIKLEIEFLSRRESEIARKKNRLQKELYKTVNQ